MKLPTIIVIMLLASVSMLHADTCIKHVEHTDGYYYGGQNNPPVDREYTVWIGETKIAFMHEYRTVIFDVEANTMVFANAADSTYVEVALPLDLAAIMPEADVSRLMMFQTVGAVAAADSAKNILERECSAYNLHYWIPYEGTKYNEEVAVAWMSTTMPFDLGSYRTIYSHLLTLRNNSAELIEQYKPVVGYPLLVVSEQFIKGFGVHSVDEVVEVLEKEPPADVYSVPGWFTKKEQLTLQDLQGGA